MSERPQHKDDPILTERVAKVKEYATEFNGSLGFDLPLEHPLKELEGGGLPFGQFIIGLDEWEDQDFARRVEEELVGPYGDYLWEEEFSIRHEQKDSRFLDIDPYDAVAVKLWGTREEATRASFEDVESGSRVFIVNRGGGIGSQERNLVAEANERGILLDLVLIDNNQKSVARAENAFNELNEKYPKAINSSHIIHDDMGSVNDQITGLIENLDVSPDLIVDIQVYSNYGTLFSTIEQLDSTFEISGNTGIPVRKVDVSLDATFDRRKLREKLGGLIGEYKSGAFEDNPKMKTKVEAFLAYYERIGAHGDRIGTLLPTRDPVHVTNYLKENGYSESDGFVVADESILAGQANLRVIEKKTS